MGTSVDVSIIVPCYNTARYLDQALSSIEQNCSFDLEILAINDGSTDNSLQIMQAHARRDARICIIDKPNEGYGATVNRGIEYAKGTYIAILEPDDYVLPFAYDRLLALARAHDFPDVVKAGYWRIITNGTASASRAYGYLRGRVKTIGSTFTLADEPELIQYHPSIWAALYRKGFLNREGIRFKEVPGAGWVDNPFSVETLVAARSIVYTDEAYYCYREDLATASSAHVSASLMIERWNERQDILDARGVDNEGILRANTIAGLRFLNIIYASDALDDANTREAVVAMVRRMDPAVLQTVHEIHPRVVAQTLRLAGVPEQGPSGYTYATHLASEAWWALRHNGVKFLAYNLMLAHKR